jgi:hypothetical protein
VSDTPWGPSSLGAMWGNVLVAVWEKPWAYVWLGVESEESSAFELWVVGSVAPWVAASVGESGTESASRWANESDARLENLSATALLA